ncbi:MAG: alpha-amylase family glycosyl hydrolase [Alistipes sp.]|nr:alpha-amylase family glycosyl hydrolase [Alistipes senegalensis]MCM1250112.1 alpha-amylase family glycosyl hydrolase [Alistipes sp.]
MKRLFFFAALAAWATGCRGPIFSDAPAAGNGQPVIPALLQPGDNRLSLTDYFPQWERADSVTSAQLVIGPAAEDWSEFIVSVPEGPFVASFEAWTDGRCLSVAAFGGERQSETWACTERSHGRRLFIRTSQPARQVVALWQNCRLPEEYVSISDSGVAVTLPADADAAGRSWLRVFAASERARFNDLMIPLEKGRPVSDAAQLTRHDRQAQVLYSLMIDRFCNGNPDNDAPLGRPDVLPQVDYQGGDLQGIADRIRAGFFDSLGITTLWISPVTQNPRDAWGLNRKPFTRFSGYHGYWPIHTTRVDDRFGTPDDLRRLLDEAHAHGMNVILDYVANHLHIHSPVLQTHPDWVTPLYLPDGRKNLELWDEERLTTWFDEHIPTLDLARPEVCGPMTDSALYWIAEYDLDGFRHDACKHIPENYWRMLTHKMKTRFADRDLWQIGETYGSPALIGSYVRSGMIDAQFDFNVYHTALDVLVRGRSARDLACTVDESLAAYGAHHTMGNITGNHDKARLVSLAGGALSPDEDPKLAGWTRSIGVGDPVGYRKLALIEALNCTIPGVPCIYQGDEYGEPGGNDPDNRRMMRFDGYTPEEQAQRELTRKLIGLRRCSMPLLYGDMTTLALTDEVWVFARVYLGEPVVVALNFGDRPQRVECILPAGSAENPKFNANFGAGFGFAPEGRLFVELAPCGFEILTKTE